ncbi:MAG TPA: RluA family pseudouridine synthase [Candidatus Anoxymicrobiaceae bacterium]
MNDSAPSTAGGEGAGGTAHAVWRGSAEAGADDAGSRLDTFVASRTGLSRSRAQKLIADGNVLIEETPARKNHILLTGEKVSWELPPAEPESITAQEEIPLKLVYADDHLVVIDKQADLVMYPGPGHASNTLLNALLARYPDISGVGGNGRPGVFHRLDRGTSGLVAVARTEEAYRAMVDKMKERDVDREYIALVIGALPAEVGTIDAPMGRSHSNRKRMAVDRIAGRHAVSRFRVKERFGRDFTLVEVSLETGRTHQIRVHFTHIGHPVAGDPEYSRGKSSGKLGLERQFLHAYRLAFEHPATGDQLEFSSELPADLAVVLEQLREADYASRA